MFIDTIKSFRNIYEHILLAVDSDSDGFVDGIANYQVIKDGIAIDLTNQWLSAMIE